MSFFKKSAFSKLKKAPVVLSDFRFLFNSTTQLMITPEPEINHKFFLQIIHKNLRNVKLELNDHHN